jgi:hypothetical protein
VNKNFENSPEAKQWLRDNIEEKWQLGMEEGRNADDEAL